MKAADAHFLNSYFEILNSKFNLLPPPLMPHASHLIPHTSCLIPHASYLMPHTCLIPRAPGPLPSRTPVLDSTVTGGHQADHPDLVGKRGGGEDDVRDQFRARALTPRQDNPRRSRHRHIRDSQCHRHADRARSLPLLPPQPTREITAAEEVVEIAHFFRRNEPLNHCVTSLGTQLDPKREYPNFGFVAGPLHLIDEITNFGAAHKSKLIAAINTLDADYVILDMRAGLDANVIDFLPFSNSGILIFTPHLPSATLAASDIVKAINT